MRARRCSRYAARSGLPLSSLASMRIEHAAVPAARCRQPRHGGERRVAVVRRAPPVEQVALAHRLVRAEPLAPLAERRLLVHVAVDQDRVAGASVVDEQHRGAPWELDDLGGAARGSWARTQSRRSSAAAAMAPRSAQSGSKAGERHGMRRVLARAPGGCAAPRRRRWRRSSPVAPRRGSWRRGLGQLRQSSERLGHGAVPSACPPAPSRA